MLNVTFLLLFSRLLVHSLVWFEVSFYRAWSSVLRRVPPLFSFLNLGFWLFSFYSLQFLFIQPINSSLSDRGFSQSSWEGAIKA